MKMPLFLLMLMFIAGETHAGFDPAPGRYQESENMDGRMNHRQKLEYRKLWWDKKVDKIEAHRLMEESIDALIRERHRHSDEKFPKPDDN